MARGTIGLVLALAASGLYGQVDVLTAQYDLNRTSSNTQEQTLTQANVNAAQFGKLFSRTVDAPFYASPLIATNLNIPGVGVRDVVYVATLGNTVYAFDADDPNAATAYWSVNVGTPYYRGCCYLGPTIGILGTPFIDRSTSTIYFTAIVQTSDVGLYLYALDLGTGALKFNAPQRISYTFGNGATQTEANLPGTASWLQRAGLLMVNNILYVGTSAVWEGDTIFTQDGFIQAFQANDLSVRISSFDTDPTGAGGGFWQAGRGIAADSSGNVYAAVNSGAYNPPTTFGNSVVKFGPGTLSVSDWFTPSDWSFLYSNNLDISADGVTLMPGTNLAFAGGKIGVIYLLNQNSMGGLQPASGNIPLQEFQASQGCGTQQCGQQLATAYWPNASTPYLYVWDIFDTLRAYPFDSGSQRFLTGSATAGTLLPSRAGGMTISSNGSTPGTGIVWAVTAAQDPYSTAVPATLRAYNANDITQELYDSDQNSCRDSVGSFVKMSTPIVANGKVYVNTQSNVLPVYGLLSQLPPYSPPPGAVPVTVNTNIPGPTVTVDGSAPCTGSPGFNWAPGIQHTLSTSSPQVGIPGTSPQAGAPGAQFVWTGWSDGGAISHTVAPTSATTYTAYFTTQYLLTGNVSPQASGSIASSPSSAGVYYNAGAAVQLTATPISGCTFVNWTGALTGTLNPQTVTMTAPQAVTANFQCNVPAAFVTGYASKPLRNDFNGWVGMEFTVGNNALSVSALGRIMVYGNTGTHQMALVNASTGSNVAGGSVSISMPSGNAGQIAYTPLPSPVTLQPNTTYYLVSQEVASGDQWYDVGPISTTNDAAVGSAIFSTDGVTWRAMSTANTSYAPVSFLYTLGAPAQYLLSTSVSPQAGGSIAASPSSAGSVYASGASVQLTATPASGCTFVNWTGALTGAVNPQSVTMSGPQSVTANFQCSGPAAPSFLTGYALNGPSLREDFTGWVGMKLTVGANSLTVSALGRICVPNNTMAHVVKFVNVGDGSDLTGASVSLNTAGCTAGQFVYGAINPVTLPAGTSYYLVSQETYGGDQWYDEGTVSATNAAVVNSAVYSNGGSWLPIGPGNSSYVPPNFQYSVVLPAPITVTVQTSPAGSSFSVDGTTYTTAQTLAWTSGSSHSIATVSPQSPAGGTQDAWSSWSDGGAISHTVAPSSATTYTATFTTQYLLTSTVSPAGSGSIAASPSSTGGYYASGASVQLTATAASGCTLVSWSGTSNSSANPQTVTMSGPQTVTANFQCTTPPGSSFLTGYALSSPSLRSDFTGFVGMKLTVGSSPLTVSALGRICVANNSQTHAVEFVNASTALVVSGASASINMAGCTPGQFAYTSISSVTLSANTAYYMVSQETQGGDQWYDQGTVSSTTAASVNGSVYFYNGAWYPNGSANYSYGPPNFQYSTSTVTQYQLTTSVSPSGSGTVSASPSSSNGLYNSGFPVQLTATAASNCTFQNWTGTTSGTTNPITVTMSSAQTVTANFQCTTLSGTAFLTGYAVNSLRDDFGGFVGMKLTVGSTPLTVSALGRVCVANNSQIHTVEFVNAGTGLVVPGASASVNMAGCTPGQFVYGAISSIALPAGSSYYLASQETQGGDQWYDQGAVSATKDAAVNSAVYFYDGIWYPVASANSSYVPPNFQYSVGGVSQYLLSAGVSPVGGGSIAASPSSAGGLYNSGAAVQLTATPASGCAFGGWTGALTGMSNPQTVTMSGPETVTATFQCTAPASTSFLTGYALSGQPLRNDFTGWVGMKLTVGANPLTISSLGRICAANNAMTHVVKFVDASTGSDVSGASATVNMAGCTTGQFVYGAISPITFPAGSSYYLVSQEIEGGDRWYDQGAVSATNAAAVNSSVYFFNGSWYPINSTNTSYVPPNFQY